MRMYINHFTRSMLTTSFSSYYFLHRRFYADNRSSFNHYHVLGVNSNATAKEIKTAFYRLSKKYHPDVNAEDANAAKKFSTISNAYDILNDPIKRREYDYELLSKSSNVDPYVTYNRTSEYAQRARAHRASARQSSYTSNGFNGGFQGNRNPFEYSQSRSYGPFEQKQYETNSEQDRDRPSDSNNEDQVNEEEQVEEKAKSTTISKLVLLSLFLTFGLSAFLTSNLLSTMHFQQPTEEFPSRLASVSQSSRQSSAKL